ncbi:unnamed protein product [Rotaria socialis]|uniref:COMM domain-containing protein 5 n=3 Tax=Rotaria socialis TaxID=392032 RepID=A0A820PRN2_9BILA|nr:unnamed protein product [Rotaria socialis]CAF3397312.1 unnamed protein product [Rotaria socialis]CAF3502989.1 unnamed protein product [Rotaria socialis]CAF3641373.1 unnamed protein product [Rotaria socialis]CAF3647638.1 unnamed protein product [Rotaria socialis]
MPDHRSYQDPFYGWTTPKAISLCLQKLKECSSSLPAEAIKKLILMSEAKILNEQASTSPLEFLTKLSKKYSISIEHLIVIFNGFVHVLRLALKPPAAFLKPEIFKDDLRDLKFSEAIIEEFHNILFGPKRDQLYNVAQERDRPRLSFLQTFDWNLDVTLTTASLSRCIEPLLFFQFRTTDNRNLTFEVPIKKFNELRYNTALLLKEMEEVDGKQALKLLET